MSPPMSNPSPQELAGLLDRVKECPLCGSAPRVDERASGTAVWFVITCYPGCGLILEGRHEYAGALHASSTARAAAIAAWNRRAAPTPTNSPEERLAQWFNSLPCESIGAEHWSELQAIASSLKASSIAMEGPVMTSYHDEDENMLVWRPPMPDLNQNADWPDRRACVPHHNGSRVVGFVIEAGDEAWGEMGISEPLFWLERRLEAQAAEITRLRSALMAENEACAAIADEYVNRHAYCGPDANTRIAAAIRARALNTLEAENG